MLSTRGNRCSFRATARCRAPYSWTARTQSGTRIPRVVLARNRRARCAGASQTLEADGARRLWNSAIDGEITMGIATWIVLGLVAGLLAKIVMPGKDPGGIIVTILLGIAGALVGGFVGTRLGFGNISGFDLRSVAIAAGGALLLLFLNRFLKRREAV